MKGGETIAASFRHFFVLKGGKNKGNSQAVHFLKRQILAISLPLRLSLITVNKLPHAIAFSPSTRQAIHRSLIPSLLRPSLAYPGYLASYL